MQMSVRYAIARNNYSIIYWPRSKVRGYTVLRARALAVDQLERNSLRHRSQHTRLRVYAAIQTASRLGGIAPATDVLATHNILNFFLNNNSYITLPCVCIRADRHIFASALPLEYSLSYSCNVERYANLFWLGYRAKYSQKYWPQSKGLRYTSCPNVGCRAASDK